MTSIKNAIKYRRMGFNSNIVAQGKFKKICYKLFTYFLEIPYFISIIIKYL